MTDVQFIQGGGTRPTTVRRVFVTGASGYVGRNVVRHFVAKGVQVVGLVRRTDAEAVVRAANAEAVLGDILDPSIARVMAGCDALVHAAADTDHGLGGDVQRKVNEDGTRNVFAAARAAGISAAIHLSSDSVLADGNPIVKASEAQPYPKRPAGSYSRTKAAAERSALTFNSPQMRVIVLRPRMVWGRDDTTALPMLVHMARTGQLAWISGGQYQTSSTHIDNLCHGIDLAFQRGRGGEIYFITDGEPTAFRTIVTEMLETQGIVAPDKIVPRAVVKLVARVGQFAGKVSRGRIVPPLTMQAFATSAVEITLDIGKARRELGYEPIVDRASGMADLRETFARFSDG
ncbi:epimerase [Sphingomonas sp. Root710]|uniref:NAD-dependent epimerase/dehydratase family protein n=1 Tax=Sphingomonas sp. Root710 TaxID=1736594 RepID=UPI0007017EBE|nr:NAD-dependent epimerase/dehydratase family protein [Sphingomonas sp. Root710]KRB83026.1 epimerase [Sphingomonas sp. Root710]